MILVIKIDDGDWDAIEGKSAGELGSIVSVLHKGRELGIGEVQGFKEDGKANKPLRRFANTE